LLQAAVRFTRAFPGYDMEGHIIIVHSRDHRSDAFVVNQATRLPITAPQRADSRMSNASATITAYTAVDFRTWLKKHHKTHSKVSVVLHRLVSVYAARTIYGVAVDAHGGLDGCRDPAVARAGRVA